MHAEILLGRNKGGVFRIGSLFQGFGADLVHDKSEDDVAGQVDRLDKTRYYFIFFWTSNAQKKTLHKNGRHDEKVCNDVPDDHSLVNEVLI